MVQGLSTCEICHRQVLDTGVCLYCTTNEALNLRDLAPDHTLAPPPAAKVIALLEVESGKKYLLNSARVRIGRDAKNQIVIDDLYASRHHSFVTYEDEQYWVEDLGSKNGTKLNGSHLVDREVLNLGDLLTVGRTDFRVDAP